MRVEAAHRELEIALMRMQHEHISLARRDRRMLRLDLDRRGAEVEIERLVVTKRVAAPHFVRNEHGRALRRTVALGGDAFDSEAAAQPMDREQAVLADLLLDALAVHPL